MFRVSDILEFYPTNSLSWDQLDYETNEIYNLHYGLIHVGLPTLVDLTKNTFPSIRRGIIIQNYELCKEGDIAFADASEDTNEVAKVVEFVNTDNKQIVCGLHCIHGRDTKNKTITGFKGYAFSSTAFHNQIRSIAQGTKIYSINRSNFSECYISIPTKEEQKKITTLLSLLDERIATQSEAIAKLQSLMVGLTDKIIEKQLGNNMVDFSSLYSKAGEGGTPTTSNEAYYNGGTIPFIKIDDLSERHLTKNKDFITELGLKKSSAWIVPKNSIIYSNGATIGAISINTYPVCTKQGILGIVPSENVAVEYLYLLMSSTYFKKEVERIVTEGTMRTAYLKDINNVKCPLPPLWEQQSLYKCASSLSEKISLERAVLKKLKVQKQYLLQNMFI